MIFLSIHGFSFWKDIKNSWKVQGIQVVGKETIREPIKSLIFNKGWKYISMAFIKICGELGIKQNLTQLHTLHQNGVSEWKNHIFLEWTKNMFFPNKLPNEF